MWSLAATALSWFLGLFGFGKPDPFKQGENAGKSETTAADYRGELNDIAKASAARDAVTDDAATILSDSANRGPAQRS